MINLYKFIIESISSSGDNNGIPSGAELEYFVAMSMNLKGNKDIYSDPVTNLKAIMDFDNRMKSKSAKDKKRLQEKFDLLLNYYKNNKNDIDKWAEDAEIGEKDVPFKKISSNRSKTDLISANGKKKISLKKSGRSQLASGSMNESKWMKQYFDEHKKDMGLNDNDMKKLEEYFNDEELSKSIAKSEKSKLSNKHKDFNNLLKKSFNGPEFKKYIIENAVKGHNENENYNANIVMTIDTKAGKMAMCDADDYVNHVVKAEKNKPSINVSFKSRGGSDETYTAIRIFSNTNIKMIDEINQKTKESENDDSQGKEEDVYDEETGKYVKRIVYTGPKGGRYYKTDDGEKVYVDESLKI